MDNRPFTRHQAHMVHIRAPRLEGEHARPRAGDSFLPPEEIAVARRGAQAAPERVRARRPVLRVSSRRRADDADDQADAVKLRIRRADALPCGKNCRICRYSHAFTRFI